MLQKSSVRKGFCAEDWRMWRVKWYIQHAGKVVFTMLPACGIFLEKSFRVPKVVPKIESYQFREKIFFLMYVEYQK